MPPNKRHNKLPLNLDTSKMPIKAQKAYVAYLWFKSLTTSDRLFKSDLKPHKNKAYYWGKKLHSMGFVEDCGTYYRIKAYKTVWRQLDITRIKANKADPSKRKCVKYIKLYIKEDNFLKDGIETIQKFLVRRNKRQLRYVLYASPNSKHVDHKTVRFGVAAVAKTLGYSRSSVATASKYREKYFRLEPGQTPVLRAIPNHIGGYSYKYDCFKISLKLD